MTTEQYNEFCYRVANTTNFCCIAVIWIFRMPSWPDLLAALVMLFVVGHATWQTRKAERRYQKAVKDYMDAGGMVMLVKRGRRYHPVPVPLIPPRDIP